MKNEIQLVKELEKLKLTETSQELLLQLINLNDALTHFLNNNTLSFKEQLIKNLNNIDNLNDIEIEILSVRINTIKSILNEKKKYFKKKYFKNFTLYFYPEFWVIWMREWDDDFFLTLTFFNADWKNKLIIELKETNKNIILDNSNLENVIKEKIKEIKEGILHKKENKEKIQKRTAVELKIWEKK